MAREREKFDYAIKILYRDGYETQAGYDFDVITEYMKQHTDGMGVKTKCKPRTGDQKYNEFLIIIQ